SSARLFTLECHQKENDTKNKIFHCYNMPYIRKYRLNIGGHCLNFRRQYYCRLTIICMREGKQYGKKTCNQIINIYILNVNADHNLPQEFVVHYPEFLYKVHGQMMPNVDLFRD